MPELPEVEIITKGLSKVIINKKIINVKLYRNKLRIDINKSFISDIKDNIIKDVRRISKYIVIDLSNNKSILIHLGMTGRLTIEKNLDEGDLKKHSHIIINLDDDLTLVYNDVRRFGLAITMDTKDIENHELIKHIGIEPLDKSFNGDKLHELLQNKKCNIKVALLNQHIVCGIGNIYACEALFYAGVSPERSSNMVTKKECNKLAIEIKRVMEESIKAGGSTLRDYVQSDGSMGGFQNNFAVYGREGEPCKTCFAKIKKIKQSGRSTFFCEVCQK